MDPGPTDPSEPPLPRRVPWTRLARALGISLDTKSLVLAALGLVLMRAGWLALDQGFPASADVTPLVPALALTDLEDWPAGLFPTLAEPTAGAAMVAGPARSLMAPFVAAFGLGRDGWAFLHAVLAAVWVVFVWGIFGGAIARIAVVKAATGGRVGLGSALGFALGRLPALVGTPLSPFIGVAFFLAPCALLGLLYQIPGPVGASIAGVLMVLPLLAGLVMALILVGLAAGWPLMVATVAAEGEDSFDALSRSYSYVYQRPGRYALSIALAWVLGLVGLVVVGLFAGLVVHLARWGLALGAPDGRLFALLAGEPAAAGTFPAAAHRFWLGVVEVVAQGWVYSYFWTAASLIYLFLRSDVDGTPWNDVFQPEPTAGPVQATPDGDGPSEPPAAPTADRIQESGGNPS